MAGGVIPGLDFALRSRFQVSRKASSDSPISMASRALPDNRPLLHLPHYEETSPTKPTKKKNMAGKQRKVWTRREISCRTTATRDLYQSSSPSSPTDEDERLGVEAKMAKGRLDKRLRPYLKSQTNKEISLQRNQMIQWKQTIFGCERFNWILLKRKTSEQEDCAVCLEELRNGGSLDRLPCGHKFHSHCLRRWLQINPHCPYCRSRTIP